VGGQIMIKFTVQGRPKALKRHKDSTGRKYDPSSVDKGDFAIKCSHVRPREPFDFPIHVYLQFHFEKSAKAGDVTVGDIDNLNKFVFDALNGIFWKDDRYIDRITAVRCYDGNPRTEVVIREVEGIILK
jgi:Holliday junction resolvase RusA-like endonuclease